MSSIKLLGETSGEVILKAPAIAGSSQVTLPTGTVDLANFVTASSTATFTNKSGNISQWTNDSAYITNTVTGDFTVDTSTLKVDSSNNRVGVGTASPSGSLHIQTASSGATANSAADELILEGSGDCGMSFLTGTSNSARIYFGDSDNALSGVIKYDHSLNAMMFSANGAEKVRIESDGDLHADGDVIAFSTTTPSDIALKSDIEMIPNALDKIDEVRGVTFTRHNGQRSAGIIAQELEKVLPEAVREKKLTLHDGKEYKTVEYDAIHGLLINCIKELKKEIKELKNAFSK